MKLAGRILIIFVAAALVVGATVAVATISGASQGGAGEVHGMGGGYLRRGQGGPGGMGGLGGGHFRQGQEEPGSFGDREQPGLWSGLVRNVAIISAIVLVYVVIAKLFVRRRAAPVTPADG